MKIGLFTNCLYDKSWEDVCKTANEFGIRVLEVPAGATITNRHCKPSELLRDKNAMREFVDIAKKYNTEIYSLSCMGNPLHPLKRIADEHTRDLESAVELAVKLGVKVVNCFAGCPGAAEDAIYPNWIGLAYHPEYRECLKWQWEEKIVPFWKEMVGRAGRGGVKFGFEMLPGDCVYNTSTLLRLRDEVGAEEIGCCFDPAHLFWEGMDPIACVKRLGEAIVNVHAQDSRINREVVALDGVLDTTDLKDVANRAWTLNIAGDGHGAEFWQEFVAALGSVAYDGLLSIELQDPFTPVREGIRKAAAFLGPII